MNQPNLQGEVSQKTDQVIRALVSELQSMQARVRVIESTPKPVPVSVPVIAAQLQSDGPAPLNVTGLMGVLAQPQAAGVPGVTALPSLSDPLSQDGGLVSLNGILYRFNGSTEPGKWLAIGAAAVLLEDTHANRLSNFAATDYPLGTVFYETDRKVFYHVVNSSGNVWAYLMGWMSDTLANLPTLGVNEGGYLFKVTDYSRTLFWSGTAWGAVPGEIWDSGKVDGFLVDPDPNTGWKLCDGSTVNRLRKDGTTTTIVLPDLVSAANKAAYAKLGSPATLTANAAVAPTLEMNPYTPAGTEGSTSGTFAPAAGASPYVATLTGFAGTTATLTGTVSATGEPQNLVLRPWFRQ